MAKSSEFAPSSAGQSKRRRRDGLSSPVAKRARRHRRRRNKQQRSGTQLPKIPADQSSPLSTSMSSAPLSSPTRLLFPKSSPATAVRNVRQPETVTRTTIKEEFDFSSCPSTAGGGDRDVAPKNISQQLKKLDERLQAYPDLLCGEIHGLRQNIKDLALQNQREEKRTQIRHTILFDALKKISRDVNYLARQYDDAKGHNGADPRPANQMPKRAMEQCLNSFMNEMNKATDVEDVMRAGDLCVKYAADIFRSFI
ncbi:hypothetical protein QBC46DRAFT_112464 [Diplogelasinospora grovesii]|uniref:Uncharacterized protein n=1 Tax=Diplogelasinospora grovesii TaxID=303347 RepID=A0AAN6N9F6_9PEZI|nr:hypothetical protein QBC46DRAFT_112464 [Diplogelasinospora grovesii]